jgi:hypothetical protein
VIRGANLARSTIENTCWEGLDRIFRKRVGVWTLKGHQGCLIPVNNTSWVIDGSKLWPFKKNIPNLIIREYSL